MTSCKFRDFLTLILSITQNCLFYLVLHTWFHKSMNPPSPYLRDVINAQPLSVLDEGHLTLFVKMNVLKLFVKKKILPAQLPQELRHWDVPGIWKVVQSPLSNRLFWRQSWRQILDQILWERIFDTLRNFHHQDCPQTGPCRIVGRRQISGEKYLR